MGGARGGIGSVTEPSRSVFLPNRRDRLSIFNNRIRTVFVGKPTVGKTDQVGWFGIRPIKPTVLAI